MIEPKHENGVWVCPECGFKAMSRKVVENHIAREHPGPTTKPQQSESKPQAKKNGNRYHKYKIGDTTIKVAKRKEVVINDQRGWVFFQTANYVASLHKKKVEVKLITGEVLRGTLKAKDPFFVGLYVDGEGMMYINKAHILWVCPLEEF